MNTNRVLTWEQHLTLRATEGDTVAFELLMDLHRPSLNSLAMRQLRNTDDAHDVVQETFVKAFRAIKDFDPNRPLRPWLCRICSNCCIDSIRSRRREGEPLEMFEHLLTDHRLDVDGAATEAVQHEQVTDAIEKLPEHYRQIIKMRHFSHMEVNEIADRLDKPEGTVKSWLFRARAMLKKELTPALG